MYSEAPVQTQSSRIHHLRLNLTAKSRHHHDHQLLPCSYVLNILNDQSKCHNHYRLRPEWLQSSMCTTANSAPLSTTLQHVPQFLCSSKPGSLNHLKWTYLRHQEAVDGPAKHLPCPYNGKKWSLYAEQAVIDRRLQQKLMTPPHSPPLSWPVPNAPATHPSTKILMQMEIGRILRPFWSSALHRRLRCDVNQFMQYSSYTKGYHYYHTDKYWQGKETVAMAKTTIRLSPPKESYLIFVQFKEDPHEYMSKFLQPDLVCTNFCACFVECPMDCV